MIALLFLRPVFAKRSYREIRPGITILPFQHLTVHDTLFPGRRFRGLA
jgi:hypothetical protein